MKGNEERLKLANRLRECRTYLGYSQEEVANYLGISRPSISLMESGNRGVETLELIKLSELYECSIDVLIGKVEHLKVETSGVSMVARAAAKLSEKDKEEVLRFAMFLESKKWNKK
jgi:transcriptional regulator with XRE-family HTH domain